MYKYSFKTHQSLKPKFNRTC